MRIKCIKASDSARAILIFAGWAMDSNPFAGLHKDGYDIYVAYDYRDMSADTRLLGRYDEICVIAWSWGVPSAAAFIASHPGLPVTAAIAVNGTLTPIDDERGIPANIFQGTLDGLSEASLLKFYRRVCGSGTAYRQFTQSAPLREFESLKPELEAIRDNGGAADVSPLIFDRVIIGDADMIIPTVNQWRAWKGHPCVTGITSSHLPDFQQIIDLYIHDKSLIGQRFSSASDTYPDEARVQRHIAGHLADLWRGYDTMAQPKHIIEFGVGCGFMTDHYIHEPWCKKAALIDLYPGISGVETGDAETYRFMPQEHDTIVSASAMQWFNSPRRFLQRAADALPSGGIIVLSGFGERHFSELHDIIPRSLYYYSTEEFAAIVPDGLQLVAAEDEEIRMDFKDMRDLLSHLRLTGVNAVVSNRAVGITRRILTSLNEQTPPLHLTYHPTYYILKKT